ncbi:hypothetical protein HanPI659440_Chr09g0357371 [Helianthus annuus]|nr:hypothetical protein HanPI659440_Chr09g0357371 [Helianthus annuus]
MDGIGSIQLLLEVVRDIGRISSVVFSGEFKKDCTDLSSRMVLLSRLFKEIMDFKGCQKAMGKGTMARAVLSVAIEMTTIGLGGLCLCVALMVEVGGVME